MDLGNYLPIGFAFGSGAFNAVPDDTTGTIGTTISAVSAPAPRAGSFETVLQNAKSRNYYFDLRTPSPSDVSRWFVGPEYFRNVGSAFNPALADDYFEVASLTTLFDVIVFVNTVTPTHLLPLAQ